MWAGLKPGSKPEHGSRKSKLRKPHLLILSMSILSCNSVAIDATMVGTTVVDRGEHCRAIFDCVSN